MTTVKFYTLGCKINQYETQVIREQFQRFGFQESEDNLPAEICVINTCTVTHRADRHSLYIIRRICRENPNARVIVTGCLTQFDADKITHIPGVSLIVKNEDKHQILSLLDDPLATRYSLPTTQSGITCFKNHTRAFLKVQDGCNYRCSYCKVRLVRGKSRSRVLIDIIEEAEALVRNGYSEIVLCGICLGSYGNDLIPASSLVELIQKLEEIQGYFRIRLSSIEAGDITEQLIKTLTKSKRLCRHLHIPVQSGDDQILKRMNRTYSVDQYIQLIKLIRRYIPEIAITTDVMVGFHGEAEANFENTLTLIKEIEPLRIHIFPYSKRLNTPACGFGDFVSKNEIKTRMATLEKVIQAVRLAYCQRFIARVSDVLIEGLVNGSPDLWEGYTDNYIKVRVKSKFELKNQIIQAKLKKIYKDFVLADIVFPKAL